MIRRRMKMTPTPPNCCVSQKNTKNLKLSSSMNNNSISAKMEISRKISQICTVRYKPPLFI
jgi:hypothetical protein